MAIGFDTGNTRTAPCATCGVNVSQAESSVRTHKGTQLVWIEEHHNAPCGAPCIGGGVSHRDYARSHRSGKCGVLGCPGGVLLSVTPSP